MPPDAYRTGQALQLQCKTGKMQRSSFSSLLFYTYFNSCNKMWHCFSWKRVVFPGSFYNL